MYIFIYGINACVVYFIVYVDSFSKYVNAAVVPFHAF